MKLSHLILAVAFYIMAIVLPATHHAFIVKEEEEQVVELPRKILDLAKLISELTIQIRGTNNREPCTNCTDFQVFEKSESSWAVVTRTPENYCLAVFSESATVWDWIDNLNPGWSQYCGKADGKFTCCQIRLGFEFAYQRLRKLVNPALRQCAESCNDENECVVLGGASKGAATAHVAAMYLRDLNPYIVGLATVQTITPASCPFMSSNRTFGFINTFTNGTNLIEVSDKYIGLVYDVVPFLLPIEGAIPFGKNFLLSDDETGVAFLGQDTLPLVMSKGPFAADVHYLRSRTRENSGYEDHIIDILNALPNDDDFVRTTGFAIGSTCNYPFECESKNCDKKSKQCA